MEQKEDMFLWKIRIGNPAAGAVSIILSLGVDTVNKSISGSGKLTQPVSPPLNITLKCDGEYSYMTVMPQNTHILVLLTGYPMINWPQHGGVGPVIQPNCYIRMVINDDWKTGVVNVKYFNPNTGTWEELDNLPVHVVE
jgi:hypothetical protein